MSDDFENEYRDFVQPDFASKYIKYLERMCFS